MVLAEVDITNSVQEFFNELFSFLPELIAAVVILILGYVVA